MHLETSVVDVDEEIDEESASRILEVAEGSEDENLQVYVFFKPLFSVTNANQKTGDMTYK